MFTYNLSTPLGKLRLNIGDTVNASKEPGAGVRYGGINFTDEELTAVLTEAKENIIKATSDALLILASEYSSKATTIQFGSVREEMELVASELRRQSTTWYGRWKEQERDRQDGLVQSTSSGYMRVDVVF